MRGYFFSGLCCFGCQGCVFLNVRAAEKGPVIGLSTGVFAVNHSLWLGCLVQGQSHIACVGKVDVSPEMWKYGAIVPSVFDADLQDALLGDTRK